MKLAPMLAGVLVAASLGSAAPAQTAAPAAKPSAMHSALAKLHMTHAPPAQGMSTTPTMNQVGATQKTAISKACSAQADAKQLHGKTREAFRRGCKKTGAKA